MVRLCCPVCGEPLETGKTVWRCGRGHCFDVARQGYVNLLPVTQKHSRSPGDSPAQVAARRAFLEGGYYRPIADQAAEWAVSEQPGAILDAGCGEGYYLGRLGPALPAAERWGIDISKDAVRLAAGRDKAAHWITGTSTHLPFRDGCFDLVLAMFTLTAAAEFHRVLRPGGALVQVLAGPDHLLALRRLIYPEIRAREKDLHPALEGFRLEATAEVRFSFRLTEAAQIQNLLAMTPHFMRISEAGAHRLRAAEALEDTAQAVCNLYRAI